MASTSGGRSDLIENRRANLPPCRPAVEWETPTLIHPTRPTPTSKALRSDRTDSVDGRNVLIQVVGWP